MMREEEKMMTTLFVYQKNNMRCLKNILFISHAITKKQFSLCDESNKKKKIIILEKFNSF